MRDGTRLATEIWLPAGEGPWPVALLRTPYGKGTNTAVPISRDRLVQNGIAVVSQDVRGRSASEGESLPTMDDGWGERQDGVDTLAWVRGQSWCNSRVATFGSSYLGMTQYLLAGAGPEGVVGQHVTVAPISLFHYGMYQNGVFRRGDMEAWQQFTRWTPAALPTWRAHATYDDYWRGQDLSTRLEQVRSPMVHVGGWFDLFSQGTIDAFTQLQERGGEGARGRQHLVIGPWEHLSLSSGVFARKAGEITFPANAVLPPEAPDGFEWLSFWLKGQPETPANEPAVRYYVMGDVTDPQAPGNAWRTAERWPPPSRPLRLYFAADGGLTREPPPTAATRSFDYDPASPVPSLGGQNLFVPGGNGPRDQRSLETRPDVVVFTTPPLTEPLEVTGRITVRLTAATTARDTDFTAKLTDVYPDGRSMLVADGIVRTRFRQSLSEPTAVVPGEPYGYDIDLWSTSIVINRGHRIRVAISSSNAPRFEANANTWPDADARPVVARQTIALGGPEASHIILPEPIR
jgi:putative CocE/NonD family hydrolase